MDDIGDEEFLSSRGHCIVYRGGGTDEKRLEDGVALSFIATVLYLEAFWSDETSQRCLAMQRSGRGATEAAAAASLSLSGGRRSTHRINQSKILPSRSRTTSGSAVLQACRYNCTITTLDHTPPTQLLQAVAPLQAAVNLSRSTLR